jgi:hypothetical protein
MSRNSYKDRGLSAGVFVALKPTERKRLKQILFDRGNVTLQSFFRQVALEQIRRAQGYAEGDEHVGDVVQ